MKKFEVNGHEPSYLPEGEWKLVWNDEFDGPELDRSKWDFRLNFWGKKAEAYIDEGIVFDGNSNIEFHRVEKNGYYVSPQLQTGSNSFDIPKEDKGMWGDIWPLGELPEPKFMHRYGYYEVRCKFQKIPESMACAFWTQSPSIGTTYDPQYSGIESDIMEQFETGKVTTGNIYGGYGKNFTDEGRVTYDLKETEDGFHTFGMHWTENEYVFYCDGEVVSRTSENVSKVPQFILLTTEIKGYRQNEPLKIGEECVSGNAFWIDERKKVSDSFIDDCFVVDYVRVFDEVR